MKDLSKQIVDNLRKIIALRNLKQATVGLYANISESQFSRVLSGQVQLSINQLADIASGLNMRVIDIITFPKVYISKEESEEEGSEVLLQLRLRKEKKEQFLRYIFGNDIEFIEKKLL